MDKKLVDLKVAILAADGFEQSEMTEPRKALEAAGAQTFLISPKNTVKGWQHGQWGDEFKVDVILSEANANDYQALLLPGGVMNPDKLRMNDTAISFIKEFVQQGKPIASICHGPWTLINAEGLMDRTVTSWPSIKLDLINAGAKWLDKEVVVDENLVTSRKPDDIPAFNKAMIELFAKFYS